MITPGLWHALPTLVALAAVLADWRLWMGEDFAWASHFLRPTGKVAPDYPCTGKPDCGCRHELERLEGNQYRWACCCGVGDCPAVTVAEAEVKTYELDVKRMAAAVARALGFEWAGGLRGLYAGPRVRQVGTYGRRRSPVFLVLCVNEEEFLESLKQIASVCDEPFIVLAPTARLRSRMVESLLEDLHSAYIPVAPCVRPDGAGEFQMRSPIDKLLGPFRAGLGEEKETVMEEIRRKMTVVGEDVKGLSKTREPVAEASEPEVRRVMRLFGELMSMGVNLKASPAQVFDVMVFQGHAHKEAARECQCAPSLITRRVAMIEEHFGMSIEKLRNYASVLTEMRKTVKGQGYVQKKHGAPEDEPGQYAEDDKADTQEDEDGCLPEERPEYN